MSDRVTRETRVTDLAVVTRVTMTRVTGVTLNSYIDHLRSDDTQTDRLSHLLQFYNCKSRKTLRLQTSQRT